MRNKVHVGDKIYIIDMIGEPEYANTKGIVKYIWDSIIVGTWGNKPLTYTDNFIVFRESQVDKTKRTEAD